MVLASQYKIKSLQVFYSRKSSKTGGGQNKVKELGERGGQIPYTRGHKHYHRWNFPKTFYGTRVQEVPVTNEKLKLGEQRRKYVYICLGIVVIDSSIYIHVYALYYSSTCSIFLSFIRFAICLKLFLD